MALGLGMLIGMIKPYLNKIGESMHQTDKEFGAKDSCLLITKKVDPATGKTQTFMSYIERPGNLGELYLKGKDGKPVVFGIEGLIKLIDNGKED